MDDERFIGLENIENVILQDESLSRVTIDCTFSKDKKRELVKNNNSSVFYHEVLKALLDCSKQFPYNEYVLISNKDNDEFKIKIAPIHGSA